MPAHQSSTFFSPSELAYIHSSLSSTTPIRPDSRSPTAFRPLIAETSLLPSTYGSSRVCFSDGTECIVGIRGEVEKSNEENHAAGTGGKNDDNFEDEEGAAVGQEHGGNAGYIRAAEFASRWIGITIDIPGSRDDDAGTAFLVSMLHEALVAEGHLGRRLFINRRFHWHLYVDILLLSPPTSLPLPLLSLSLHLALLDTQLPALVSMGEEDPLFNDDWDASLPLYSSSLLNPTATATSTSNNSKAKGKAPVTASEEPPHQAAPAISAPPITLLLMSVGTNIFFDPSPLELAVAESVLAISITATATPNSTSIPPTSAVISQPEMPSLIQIISMRTITPPSQLAASAPEAAAAAAAAAAVGENVDNETAGGAEGIWRTPVGGVKRAVVKEMMKLVTEGGVGKEVLDGLKGFLGGGGEEG